MMIISTLDYDVPQPAPLLLVSCYKNIKTLNAWLNYALSSYKNSCIDLSALRATVVTLWPWAE